MFTLPPLLSSLLTLLSSPFLEMSTLPPEEAPAFTEETALI
jgi:hypothetical protein